MKLNKLSSLLLGAVLAMTLIGCTKEDKAPYIPEIDDHVGRKYFNVVISTSASGSTATYTQAFDAAFLANPENSITAKSSGYEVPSIRTARVLSSNSGAKLYNLNYGGGTVTVFDALGGDKYVKYGELDFSSFVGTEYARWTRIDNSTALIHNVLTTLVEDDNEVYSHHKSEAKLLPVNLPTFTFGAVSSVEIPRSAKDDELDLYISRIDNPAVVGGKAYYGLSKSRWNKTLGKNYSTNKNLTDDNGNVTGPNTNNYWKADYPSTSFVVDYPSLTNPKVIESTFGTGSNYGYRMPVAHAHAGSIYQAATLPGKMLKITNGEYDNTYDFDIKTALGVDFKVYAMGWFHAGGGIGYLLFRDQDKQDDDDKTNNNSWGVARVDVVAKTAVRMALSNELSLGQYQGAVVDGDKVYMAIAPVGQEGNIYIFDPTNTTANGFTKGAKLETGGGISYIGVF